jgi:hypothetical protein
MAEARDKQKQAYSCYAEPLQTLILLHEEARDIAERLKAVAKLLKEDPTRIDKLGGQAPSYEEVFDLTNRIRQVREKCF